MNSTEATIDMMQHMTEFEEVLIGIKSNQI